MYLVLIFILGGIASFIMAEKTRNNEIWQAMGAIIFLLALVSLIGFFVTYSESLNRMAQLQADYEVNIELYRKTTILARSFAPLPTASGSLLSAENLQMATKVVDKISDLRDKYNKYNEGLAKYRKYEQHWFFCQFITKVPSELKFMKFEDADFKN